MVSFERPKKRFPRPYVFIVGGLATIIVLLHLSALTKPETNERVLSQVNGASEGTRALGAVADDNNARRRPVMHTFYSRIKDDEWHTGMSDRDDSRLLEVWSTSWKAAGWDVKILGIDDAATHPDFEWFESALAKNAINPYNRLCFLRWLAMANVGGGWASDYDMIPLPTDRKQSTTLPYDGNLTVYEYTLDGGVPSLVSGSADEWYRMGKLLVEKTFERDITSDMFAMIWYHHNEPESYKMVNKVIKGHVPLSGRVSGKEMCTIFKGNIAIHFSHAAVRSGVNSGILKTGMGPGSRAQISEEWIKEWIHLCGVLE